MALIFFMLGFAGFAISSIVYRLGFFKMDFIGNFYALSGVLSLISIYMMHKYRFVNEAGLFCAGDYADRSDYVPLYLKGKFFEWYLNILWVVLIIMLIICISACGLICFAKRNRPGSIKM